MSRNLVSPSLVGTIADLKLFDGAAMFDQHVCAVANGGNGLARNYRFTAGLASTDATDQLVVSPTTGAATGRWLRTDPVVDLKFAWAFNTANNTTLVTVPTGMRLHVFRFVPEITSLGGIDTGSIGVDSNISSVPGGLGMVTGLLGGFQGVMGVDINTPQRTTLVAGDVFRHNLLVAGYTSGTGFWHIVCSLLQL